MQFVVRSSPPFRLGSNVVDRKLCKGLVNDRSRPAVSTAVVPGVLDSLSPLAAGFAARSLPLCKDNLILARIRERGPEDGASD